MHGDDNKAPAEIAVTTLGHPDPVWRLKGLVTLSRQFRFLFLMPFYKWIKQHKSENVHALYCKTPNIFTLNAY